MANEQNQTSVNAEKNGLPTRMLRIEGERTARMFANAIRVSRIDARLRELSLSTKSEQRKQHRLGDEGFSRAMAQFEDLLTMIEKDVASINGAQPGHMRSRQNSQGSQAQPRNIEQRAVERDMAGAKQPPKPGVVSRIISKLTSAEPQGELKAPQQTEAQPQPQQPRRPKKRKKPAGTKTGQQTNAGQKQGGGQQKPQQAAQKAAPATPALT